MTLKGYDGPERVLFHYDVSGGARPKAATVCQIVFGRTRSNGSLGNGRRQKGFIHRPGVVWVGQSVLLLPARDAEELRSKLWNLGIRVSMGPVSVPRGTLEAFRRPRRAPA